jgi:heat shock protein HslJ
MALQLEDPFRKWLLVRYRDSKNRLSITGLKNRPFLIFMPDGKVTGSGGCNRFFSSFEITGSALKMGLIGATRMYCHDPPWLMDMEGDFFSCLERCSGFELAEDSLTVFDAEGKQLLGFIRDEEFP